jgi:hypothetical protein
LGKDDNPVQQSTIHTVKDSELGFRNQGRGRANYHLVQNLGNARVSMYWMDAPSFELKNQENFSHLFGSPVEIGVKG